MKKLISLHLSTILLTIAIFAFACYCLLNSKAFSISAMIAHEGTFKITHILIMAFLPIYIAGVIFGAFMLGIYFGPFIQQSFFRRRPKK